MSKVFIVNGYWKDDHSSIDGYLVTDIHGTPDGYEDEDIFYYGVSEADLVGEHGDFVITGYKVESEG